MKSDQTAPTFSLCWRHWWFRRPSWHSGAISGTGIRSQPGSAPGCRVAGAAASRWAGFRALWSDL